MLDRLKAALADRYRVERELGHGGMALVFLAQDLKHHRPVAIKVLRPELGALLGPERFLREIEIAASLTHPHILSLYDSGEARGLLYYVMPYVSGESLRDRLSREKQLPIEDALAIAREVADALGHAHSLGVIHRDVKPENVLFEAGHAVVSDFGIARAVTAAGGERLTETGIALGTPAYMSPEQAAGERELDRRSDVYSLACVLYEMLAGQPPFTGSTLESVLHQHLAAEPPALSGIRAAVPAGVWAAIRRALAKTPADRFDSALQLAEALRTGGIAPATQPRAESWRSGRRIALASLVAVTFVGVLVLWPRGPRVVPAASVIAVAPFAPTTADTALYRLGRDLVVTLSANLDGVGDIRAVDAQAILQQSATSPEASTQRGAAALARRFGAGSVVHGTLVRVGPAVRLELALLTTDSLTELARASVTASAGDVIALTDSATWSLLRQVWRARDPPSPSLGSVTTRSVNALREFLDGERATFQNRWGAAESAYARAIQADSQFWLAYWRYSYTLHWQNRARDTLVWRPFWVHRYALTERDRTFIEIVESNRQIPTTRFLLDLQDFLTRYPDYWYGWWEYSDQLVHNGTLVGYTATDARAALERTLVLMPRLQPAWEHLLWMSLGRDSAAVARAIVALPDVEVEYARMLSHVDRGSGLPDSLLLSRYASRLARDPNPGTHRFWAFRVSWFGFPRTQIQISRRVVQSGVALEVRAAHLRGIALAWAARGAWDSAVALMDRVPQRRDLQPVPFEAYRLAVLGAWIGALDAGEARGRRERAVGALADRAASDSAELYWLDGLLAAIGRDAERVRQFRTSLSRTSDGVAAELNATLAAMERDLSGQRGRAARELAAAVWRVDWDSTWVFLPEHPFLRGVNRLLASRWLLAAGDTAQAARMLTWPEASLAGPRSRSESEANAIMGALAYLDHARIEDALGRDDLARDYYEQFLRRYDMPVPALRHLVEEARAALARLEGRRRGEEGRRP